MRLFLGLFPVVLFRYFLFVLLDYLSLPKSTSTQRRNSVPMFSHKSGPYGVLKRAPRERRAEQGKETHEEARKIAPLMFLGFWDF
jgi:hypothetical protein